MKFSKNKLEKVQSKAPLAITVAIHGTSRQKLQTRQTRFVFTK